MLLLPVSAAGSFAQSGTTGTLTWTLSDSTLIISGKGAMPDYDYPDYAPWSSAHFSIKTVIIKDGVTSIGESAFSHCSSLTEVINLNTKPQEISNCVFDYVNLSNATLYVPAKSIEVYKAAGVWKNFGTVTADTHLRQ